MRKSFLVTSFKSISNFARMACISLIRSCRASSTLSAWTRKSRALFIRIESKVDRSLIWKGFRELFYFLDNENGMSHRSLSNSLTVLQGSTGEMFPELFGWLTRRKSGDELFAATSLEIYSLPYSVGYRVAPGLKSVVLLTLFSPQLTVSISWASFLLLQSCSICSLIALFSACCSSIFFNVFSRRTFISWISASSLTSCSSGASRINSLSGRERRLSKHSEAVKENCWVIVLIVNYLID